jgi:excinuclease ABC subunit C
VGLIDEASYQEEVQHAVLFLAGKSQAVIDILVGKMQTAATALAFEKAAAYRDQIKSLRTLQERQYVSTEGGNVDIVVAVSDRGIGCVQVLMVRDGRQLGNRAFFPDIPPIPPLAKEVEPTLEKGSEGAETLSPEGIAEVTSLLAAFLPQYYLAADREIPEEIIVNQELGEGLAVLAEVISTQSGKPVLVHSRVRGTRARWVEMAVENAKASLRQRPPSQYRERLDALSLVLKLAKLPQRIECFDVSHTFGEATVASCVVFDADGPCHSAYRRFNIENITPGDDYAALRQALTRHYRGSGHGPSASSGSKLTEILLIDGGIGQVRVAQQVLADLQLQGIRIMGVAKGPGRKPGLETLILSKDESSLTLPKDSPALHLIQQIRDEAHRFAIMAHRGQRAKMRRTSILEEIAGIGPKRRQRLLCHFGGLEGISRAGIEDLVTVPGISRALAQTIYEFFNG